MRCSAAFVGDAVRKLKKPQMLRLVDEDGEMLLSFSSEMVVVSDQMIALPAITLIYDPDRKDLGHD